MKILEEGGFLLSIPRRHNGEYAYNDALSHCVYGMYAYTVCIIYCNTQIKKNESQSASSPQYSHSISEPVSLTANIKAIKHVFHLFVFQLDVVYFLSFATDFIKNSASQFYYS